MLQICLHPHTNILIQRQKVNDPENVQRPSYLRNVHACVPQKPEICVWINKQFTCFKAFRTPTLCLNRAPPRTMHAHWAQILFFKYYYLPLNMTVNTLATVILSLNPHQRLGRGSSLACGSDLILTLNHFMKPSSPVLARQPPGWVHLENNKFLFQWLFPYLNQMAGDWIQLIVVRNQPIVRSVPSIYLWIPGHGASGRGRGHYCVGVTTLGPITGHGNTRPGSVNMHRQGRNTGKLLPYFTE